MQIIYQGKRRNVVHEQTNATTCFHFFEGRTYSSPPKNAHYVGYVLDEDNRKVYVYQRSYLGVVLAMILVLLVSLLICLICTHSEVIQLRVSFSETPQYTDGVLYCNVTNVERIPITVQFLGIEQASTTYTLQAGESLPYINIDFIPTVIRFQSQCDFIIEVSTDG